VRGTYVVDTSQDRVPQGVIERLPQYLNVLIQLRQERQETVSSARLGELTEVNPAQIRRDLTHFGSFGKRGIGYDVATLIERIQRILGSDQKHRLALVGAGHLGSAIAGYQGLSKHGFIVSAVFDSDPDKVGGRIGDLKVRDVADLGRVVAEQGIRIGVVAVPQSAAQSVTDQLAAAGVKVVLNYTPMIVKVPDGVTLHNTDPVQELLHTLYYLSRPDGVARSGS
jgi:redox-sensing transcriptional repressor